MCLFNYLYERQVYLDRNLEHAFITTTFSRYFTWTRKLTVCKTRMLLEIWKKSSSNPQVSALVPRPVVNGMERNKRRNLWIGRCVSSWWPLFRSRSSVCIYALLYEFCFLWFTNCVLLSDDNSLIPGCLWLLTFVLNNTLILGIWCSTIPHLPGCFCPWNFFPNVGFNMVPSDPFMSHLATQLGYSAGEFQALQLIVLATFGVVD